MQEIKLFAVHMPHAVDKPLLETLHSGYIGQGPKVDQFEARLADWFGNKNVLTLNSGTSALQLALRLAEVEGGEVVTTPMTCTATNLPILAERASIVWADVLPDSGLIDPLDVERKITDDTRAIMCVHWGGTPCDLEALNTIANKYQIPLIEDCAHALGSSYGGQRIGNRSADFSCFSLQAIKHITTVDGGLLICDDTENYKRGKLLRWYGIDRETDRKDMRCEEDLAEWGYKFHMNDVAATIGLVQIEYAESLIRLHRANAAYYMDKLRDFQFAFSREEVQESAMWLCTLLMSNAEHRLSFMQHMKQWGIMTSQVHARNDTHTAFSEFRRGPLPGVDAFSERMVCIPVHWGLEPEQLERVVDACRAFEHSYSMG